MDVYAGSVEKHCGGRTRLDKSSLVHVSAVGLRKRLRSSLILEPGLQSWHWECRTGEQISGSLERRHGVRAG